MEAPDQRIEVSCRSCGVRFSSSSAVAVPVQSSEPVQAAERSSSTKEEDLDIPAFLRRSR